MREVYLDMAVAMGRMGSEALRATARHSRQFLRGITDFDAEGNYAWKDGRFAPGAYRYSVAALPHANLRAYGGVLHGEHVIPVTMVFERWLELIDAGASEAEQRAHLDGALEVIWITVEERLRVDRDLGLSRTMPDGWSWGDDPLARLSAAEITIAPSTQDSR